MDIKNINFDELDDVIYNYELNKNNLNKYNYQNELQLMKTIILQSKLLSNNYNIVATNPPYMGNSSMNPHLKDYLKNNYPNSKSDLFAVFIEKCHDFCKEMGFIAMITQQSFMFLSTFENLRVGLINNHTIIDMAHLGARAFDEIGGEVVQATSFINRNNFIENYNSTFHRLTEFNSESKKEEEFHNDENKFETSQLNFDKIPGSPIVYWAEDSVIRSFEKGELLGNLTVPRNGMKTGDNNRFVRYWWEINYNKFNNHATNVIEAMNSSKKYFPYNKGGETRKWYGNEDFVVNWENGGKEIFSDAKKDKRNVQDYPNEMKFSPSVTWSLISSARPTFRYKEHNLSDIAGMSFYNGYEKTKYYLGFCNTPIALHILKMLSSTINFQAGDIGRLPIFYDNLIDKEIISLVDDNILQSKNEWDSYELSWDFKKHPLVRDNTSLKKSFKKWEEIAQDRFNNIYNNEILINNYFMKIYEIPHNTFKVQSKDITLRLSNLDEDIKSFISYVIGCMFGRYSLDDEGLQFAGGEFKINNYNKFIPDDDNIIPVLDTAYFDDDIVGSFTKFVETCFGSETLEENLDFIASVLSKSNKPSREVIRQYLLKNFFNNHKKTYKKCPIYWQFSSGKENGFNCLVYMHRYEPSLVARIRTDYLHKTQKAIEQAIVNCDNIINHSTSNTEISKATKDKSKLQKQLKETQEYDEALAHIANQNIEIDLDDGVKVNYAKFQNIEVSKEGKKSKKINLLKKL